MTRENDNAFFSRSSRKAMTRVLLLGACLAASTLLPAAMALEGGNGAEKSSNAFPSHRQNLAAAERVDLPALGLESMRARPTVQDFVRRVHREGLPVARLFETKGALVHLGLNPKGKPGLWLVQKTR